MGNDELLGILQYGDFSRCVGLVEHEQFDCKMAPYHLDTEGSQLELCKDVAAFANADGGVIVIGLETRKVPERTADVVKSVRAFPRERFKVQRCEDLITAHVYSRVDGLKLQWHPSRESSAEGVASILIARQSELRQPFLVSKVVSDN